MELNVPVVELEGRWRIETTTDASWHSSSDDLVTVAGLIDRKSDSEISCMVGGRVVECNVVELVAVFLLVERAVVAINGKRYRTAQRAAATAADLLQTLRAADHHSVLDGLEEWIPIVSDPHVHGLVHLSRALEAYAIVTEGDTDRAHQLSVVVGHLEHVDDTRFPRRDGKRIRKFRLDCITEWYTVSAVVLLQPLDHPDDPAPVLRAYNLMRGIPSFAHFVLVFAPYRKIYNEACTILRDFFPETPVTGGSPEPLGCPASDVGRFGIAVDPIPPTEWHTLA